MFGIRAENVPSLNTYAEALARWENTKPWRGDRDENERPLEGRNKRNMTIRKVDGGIACKLYHTDVVTYYADNTIEIDGSYASKSTNAFANSLACRHGSLSTADGYDAIYTCSGSNRIVRLKDDIAVLNHVVDGGSNVVDMDFTKPFKKYVLDRKATKPARDDYNYDAFREFLNAYSLTRGQDQSLPQHSYHWYAGASVYHHLEEIRNHLKIGQTGWVELAKLYALNNRKTANAFLTALRKAIYIQWQRIHGDMYKVEEIPYLDYPTNEWAGRWSAYEKARSYLRSEDKA